MPRAELVIQIPDGIWIGDATRANPEVRVIVLAAVPEEDGGVGLAELRGPDVRHMVDDVDTREDVTVVDVFRQARSNALIQFETSVPLLLLVAQRSGTVPEMPFPIQDGRATWEIVTPTDRLSELRDELDDLGISYTVESIRQDADSGCVLTESQLHMVETAVAEGYYDTPRRCTLTELADVLDVAKSTCSETLHRAEGQIVKRFVERPGRWPGRGSGM